MAPDPWEFMTVAGFQMDSMTLQWGVVIGTSLVGAVTDIRSRRIPNALTVAVALGGMAYGLTTAGFGGLGDSLLGCVILALPYVLLFLFAGGGAGDAKLMGAIGAWLGVQAGIIVLVCVAVVGGLFGLLRILAHRGRRSALGRIAAALYVMLLALCSGRKGWSLLRAEPQNDAAAQNKGLTIPYGPAIFVGVCIGAIVVHSWNG